MRKFNVLQILGEETCLLCSAIEMQAASGAGHFHVACTQTAPQLFHVHACNVTVHLRISVHAALYSFLAATGRCAQLQVRKLRPYTLTATTPPRHPNTRAHCLHITGASYIAHPRLIRPPAISRHGAWA